MPAENEERALRVLDSVTKIVSVYLEKNSIAPDLVAGFIGGVFTALEGRQTASSPAVQPVETTPLPVEQEPMPTASEALKPAVPISQSVTDDFIICLEDGKKLKVMKRYLATKYGMSPAQYREKWGLPKDYPVTAPAYAVRRSEVARQFGLGKRPVENAGSPAVEPAPALVPETAAVPPSDATLKAAPAKKARPQKPAAAVAAPTKTTAASRKPAVSKKSAAKPIVAEDTVVPDTASVVAPTSAAEPTSAAPEPPLTEVTPVKHARRGKRTAAPAVPSKRPEPEKATLSEAAPKAARSRKKAAPNPAVAPKAASRRRAK